LGVPANQPIYGELGPLVADDWADLTDGTIQASMAAATGLGTDYWTGSNDDGTATGVNCSSWTSKANSGTIGRGNVTSATWLNVSNVTCSGSNYVLGICY